MRNRVYWTTEQDTHATEPLRGAEECDSVIIGGGISGLSAAQWLREEADADVVVIEKSFCGSGATGRSSGFITPDSELELRQLCRRFGDRGAKQLWRGAYEGVHTIRTNIQAYGILCDWVSADSLLVATSEAAIADLKEEHAAHERLQFESTFLNREKLSEILGAQGYFGGVRHRDLFAINGFRYLQALKERLRERGVRIYEETPAVTIEGYRVHCPRGRVSARNIFICMDWAASELGFLTQDVFHAQTFIILSEPLTEEQVRKLFPATPLLVWDTDLIYQYFRLTEDKRLLIGGGLLRYTYAGRETDDENCAVTALLAYVKERFPFLDGLRFSYWWPGLIGVTRDLLPIAGRDSVRKNVYYAVCSAGLPWSTLAGRVAAQKAIEGSSPFEKYFSPNRAFTPLDSLQTVVGKKAAFAASHYFAKEFERGNASQIRRQEQGVKLIGTLAVILGMYLIYSRYVAPSRKDHEV